MQHLSFSTPNLTKTNTRKLTESQGRQSRIIEGIFLPGDGFDPHTHPHGEDCALLITSELTYFLSHTDTTLVHPGEVVFGWQNVLHGYHNDTQAPIHLLIFATPEETGLSYPPEGDRSLATPPFAARKLDGQTHGATAASDLSTFTILHLDAPYEEPQEDGVWKVFTDWENRELYIFENEPVELRFPTPRKLLRYTAKS